MTEQMKKINILIWSALLILLIPSATAAGQDGKSEKRIKIIVAEDGGSKVVIDTLITGNSPGDSIVLKDGRTIFLSGSCGKDISGKRHRGSYNVTTITSDNAGKSNFPGGSDKKDSNSETAKYMISRNGLNITVEGSDYDKVKEMVREIEKNLDASDKAK